MPRKNKLHYFAKQKHNFRDFFTLRSQKHSTDCAKKKSVLTITALKYGFHQFHQFSLKRKDMYKILTADLYVGACLIACHYFYIAHVTIHRRFCSCDQQEGCIESVSGKKSLLVSSYDSYHITKLRLGKSIYLFYIFVYSFKHETHESSLQ